MTLSHVTCQGPSAAVGNKQVPQEADQAVGHQQQRAGRLHLESPRQRGVGKTVSPVVLLTLSYFSMTEKLQRDYGGR